MVVGENTKFYAQYGGTCTSPPIQSNLSLEASAAECVNYTCSMHGTKLKKNLSFFAILHVLCLVSQ